MWNDTSFLLLDRIRTTINVLKKSDYCRNPNTVSLSMNNLILNGLFTFSYFF